jgi:sugar phosphate isomerase/epimerase
MKLDQVALQLYTLRDFTKTPKDVAATMKKVREIGYGAVQASAMGPIEEAEFLKILEGEGLTLCATHEPSDKLLDEPEQVAERLRKLRCKYTAYPSPRGVDFGSEASVEEWIKRLNHAGKVLHEAGQVLTYHNHHHEFRRLGGKTILERIFDQTDPRFIQGELDTYWVQHGGGDPVAWCQRLHNRLPLLHLKDYIVIEESKVTYAEIGNGNLDFKPIIDAAEKSGCEWFIVEQDTCPGDPFDSVRQSFEYIRDHLAQK